MFFKQIPDLPWSDTLAGTVSKNAKYRIWVDETNVGRIHIMKRINFRTLVAVFEELHGEIRHRNPGKIHIKFELVLIEL